MSITVEYIDHSGYVVETDRMVVIFDYVKGYLPSRYLSSGKPTIFFISHAHPDHYSTSVFAYRKTIVLSSDVDVDPLFNVCKVAEGDSLVVQGVSVKVFGSTDAGVSYYVTDQNVGIFHAGDLNLWHWKEESTEDEVQLATMQFLNQLHQIKKVPIDIAIFPVDARMQTDYDQGAREFIRMCQPKHFFPMHFRKKESIDSFYRWSNSLETTQVYIIEKPNTVFTVNL